MEPEFRNVSHALPVGLTSQHKPESDSGSDGGVTVKSPSHPKRPLHLELGLSGVVESSDVESPFFDDEHVSDENDHDDDAELADFVHDSKEDSDWLAALRLSEALDKRQVDVSAALSSVGVEKSKSNSENEAAVGKADDLDVKCVTKEIPDVVDEKDLDPQTRALLGLPKLNPEGADMDPETQALVISLLDEDERKKCAEEINSGGREETFNAQAGTMDLKDGGNEEQGPFRYSGGGYKRPRYYYDLETGEQYDSW